MGASYSKPRKLNIVSILLLIGLAGGIYAAIQFGPAYYRKWQAAEVMSETANAMYPKRMLSGSAEHDFHKELRETTVAKLRNIGVADPGLQISFSKTNQDLTAIATYREVIKHPLVNKQTVLVFRPKSSVPIRND